MKRFFLACSAVLLLAGSVPAAQTTRVKVLSDRVNIRATSSMTSEVVGQVGEGDVLLAKNLSAEWAEIVPPPGISLWTHREFIQDGVAQTKRLNVRAGPGINYSVVGSLARGDTVEVRGSFGEWIEIAPPEGCSLWVARDLVDVEKQTVRTLTQRRPPETKPAPAAKPRTPAASPVVVQPAGTASPQVPPVQQSGPAVAPVRAERAELPSRWQLIPLEGQGKRIEREGSLKRMGFVLGRPTKFRLIRYDGTRLVTICYVWGNEEQLDQWLDQILLLRGGEYWIRGCEYPILVLEEIVPRTTPAVR